MIRGNIPRIGRRDRGPAPPRITAARVPSHVGDLFKREGAGDLRRWNRNSFAAFRARRSVFFQVRAPPPGRALSFTAR